MKDIYTFGRKPAQRNYSIGDLAPLHEEMYRQRVAALKAFHAEVTQMNFPYAEQSIGMHAGEEKKLPEALDKL